MRCLNIVGFKIRDTSAIVSTTFVDMLITRHEFKVRTEVRTRKDRSAYWFRIFFKTENEEYK